MVVAAVAVTVPEVAVSIEFRFAAVTEPVSDTVTSPVNVVMALPVRIAAVLISLRPDGMLITATLAAVIPVTAVPVPGVKVKVVSGLAPVISPEPPDIVHVVPAPPFDTEKVAEGIVIVSPETSTDAMPVSVMESLLAPSRHVNSFEPASKNHSPAASTAAALASALELSAVTEPDGSILMTSPAPGVKVEPVV